MMTDGLIREVTEIISAITGVCTTAIAVMGLLYARRSAIPMLTETHDRAIKTHDETLELVKQTTEIAVNTNSLTEKLLDKTDRVARDEAVKGERRRVSEGRPEEC